MGAYEHKPLVSPVALATSNGTSRRDDPVTFTATLTGDPAVSAVPTGPVTFKEGSVTLGSGTLDGNGVASFTTSDLPVGTHAVTASYAGDRVFDGSSSDPVSQRVKPGLDDDDARRAGLCRRPARR